MFSYLLFYVCITNDAVLPELHEKENFCSLQIIGSLRDGKLNSAPVSVYQSVSARMFRKFPRPPQSDNLALG